MRDRKADRKTLAAARPLAIIAALAAFGCGEPGRRRSSR